MNTTAAELLYSTHSRVLAGQVTVILILVERWDCVAEGDSKIMQYCSTEGLIFVKVNERLHIQ